MWFYILTSILFIPICYLAWVLIHEMSHVYMAHKLVGITHWELDLIPRLDFKNFKFRFGYCFYMPKIIPTHDLQAGISLAPRIPDIIGAIILPFTCFLPVPYLFFAFVFCASSLVDLFVGSLGIHERSDLRKASDALNTSPWILRILGFGIIFCSVLVTIKNLITTGLF